MPILKPLCLISSFLVLLHAATASAQTMAEQADNPWPAIAKADLAKIRATLEQNHPGPVDALNPRFKDWLAKGFEMSQQRVKTVNSFDDYKNALYFYTNGFRDGHIRINFDVDVKRFSWPGWLVGVDTDGALKVTVAANDMRHLHTAVLLGCEGQTAEKMCAERIEQYYWNRDIPHERNLQLANMFLMPVMSTNRVRSCQFLLPDGKTVQIKADWRNVDAERAAILKNEASAKSKTTLGVRHFGGNWIITVPTFEYSGTEGVAQYRAFLIEVAKNLSSLQHAQKIVLDMRGNEGGNSAWGQELAELLWGKERVNRELDSFDETVDWRVSQDNLQHLSKEVERMKSAGLDEAMQYRLRIRDQMQTAFDKGASMLHVDAPPQAGTEPVPENPMKGQVYLLTDHSCASACLDFADLFLRLPYTTHIGLPTSADSVYIDNASSELPSGLGVLSYSLKVYRKRARGNNVWHQPEIAWPGGNMTDFSLEEWFKKLPEKTVAGSK